MYKRKRDTQKSIAQNKCSEWFLYTLEKKLCDIYIIIVEDMSTY